MKWLVNVVIVSICILIAVVGCQKSEAGNQKPQPITKVEIKTLPRAQAQAPAAAVPAVTPAPAMETAAPAPATVTAPEANKPAGEQPKIKFENTVVDLNDIKPGSKNDAGITSTGPGRGRRKTAGQACFVPANPRPPSSSVPLPP